MSKHPYHRIPEQEDIDEERETHRRKERFEAIKAKKFIGSGEDGGFYQQLKQFNDLHTPQES